MSISIVIPVLNGAAVLPRCLQALRDSSAPTDEIIVVDNGSTDKSVAVAQAAGAIVLHADARRGPAAARNLGAASASGDLLVFVDADCCVHPDTLARIRRRFSDPTVAAVIGSYDDEPAHPGWISQYKNLLHHFVHQHGRREAETFWTGCGAVRAGVFAESGGFDESFDRPCIEDIDLGYRLRAAGHRILLDPAIQVTHHKAYSLFGLFRSDIFDRALPWTRLIVASRRMPNDLNLSPVQRTIAALVALGFLALPALAAPLAVLPLLAAVLLDSPFYRFLGRKRGWRFALAAIPLKLAYYLYSAGAFAAGVVLYGLVRRVPARAEIAGTESLPQS